MRAAPGLELELVARRRVAPPSHHAAQPELLFCGNRRGVIRRYRGGSSSVRGSSAAGSSGIGSSNDGAAPPPGAACGNGGGGAAGGSAGGRNEAGAHGNGNGSRGGNGGRRRSRNAQRPPRGRGLRRSCARRRGRGRGRRAPVLVGWRLELGLHGSPLERVRQALRNEAESGSHVLSPHVVCGDIAAATSASTDAAVQRSASVCAAVIRKLSRACTALAPWSTVRYAVRRHAAMQPARTRPTAGECLHRETHRRGACIHARRIARRNVCTRAVSVARMASPHASLRSSACAVALSAAAEGGLQCTQRFAPQLELPQQDGFPASTAIGTPNPLASDPAINTCGPSTSSHENVPPPPCPYGSRTRRPTRARRAPACRPPGARPPYRAARPA